MKEKKKRIIFMADEFAAPDNEWLANVKSIVAIKVAKALVMDKNGYNLL